MAHEFNRDILYLRGLAIVLTLLAHFTFMQPVAYAPMIWIESHVAQFWSGVYLFFVISGYVITRAFMQPFERDGSPTRKEWFGQWKRFYIRRLLRIVPTAWLWIAVILTLVLFFNAHGSFGPSRRSDIWQAVAAGTFTFNVAMLWNLGPAFAPYWSLAFEEQFYLVFPSISRLSTRTKVIILCALIIGLSFVHRPPDQTNPVNSFPVDTLSYGVLIAMAERFGWTLRVDPMFLTRPLWRFLNQGVSVLALVLTPILCVGLTQGTSIVVFVCAWIVYCASFGKDYMTPPRWLLWPFKWFGEVSYSLYCLHIGVFLFAREATLRFGETGWRADATALGIASTACAVLSYASWRFVEVPTRAAGRKLSLRHDNSPKSAWTPAS